MNRIYYIFLTMVIFSCSETPPADLAKGHYVGYYYITPEGYPQSTESGLASTTIIKVDDNNIHCILNVPGLPDTIYNIYVVKSGDDGFSFKTTVQNDTFGGAKNNDIYWRYRGADTSISFWGAKY